MRAILGLAVETVARGNSLCRAAGDGQHVQLPAKKQGGGLTVLKRRAQRRRVCGDMRGLQP
jgi:hypothetical protein